MLVVQEGDASQLDPVGPSPCLIPLDALEKLANGPLRVLTESYVDDIVQLTAFRNASAKEMQDAEHAKHVGASAKPGGCCSMS